VEYVTFISQQQAWRLYRGVGSDGPLLKALPDAPLLHDLSAASPPILWVQTQSSGQDKPLIQRVSLPSLTSETIAWNGGRLGAVASSPDGQRAVVLELPSNINEQTRLWLWSGSSWNSVESQIVPDISSKLSWLEASRIVCETNERKISILDLETGSAEIGPSGCCPAAASDIREWYAISHGRVLRFPFEHSFGHPPTTLDDFSFGNVTTLRVTRDGVVFTWTEPKIGYRSKGYIQKRGERRKRFPEIDAGIGAVLGPFENI